MLIDTKAFVAALKEAAERYGLSLSQEQCRQFARYYEMLLEWNEKMNLTAITEPNEVAVKHIIDSLSVYDESLFSPGTKLIDVGSGAGFPGIPLKIFCPELKVTLLDSLGKRVNFLTAVTKELALPEVTCRHFRAEEGARDDALREKFDLAVARAVAALPVLLEYLLPFVKVGGSALALKGAKFAEEMAAAKRAVKLLGGGEPVCREIQLPGLQDKRAIVSVKKLKPTPLKYPRSAGIPPRKPL